jgi:hypothetical protein
MGKPVVCRLGEQKGPDRAISLRQSPESQRAVRIPIRRRHADNAAQDNDDEVVAGWSQPEEVEDVSTQSIPLEDDSAAAKARARAELALSQLDRQNDPDTPRRTGMEGVMACDVLNLLAAIDLLAREVESADKGQRSVPKDALRRIVKVARG